MPDPHIDVLSNGAILLGPSISADAYCEDRAIRIQSHLHADHMRGFSKSLHRDVILCPELRDLLRKRFPQLPNRSSETGIHTPDVGQPYVVSDGQDEYIIIQEAAGHMLGATQCSVLLPDGTRVGYSGDFCWPLDRVIDVNKLVVDATYGDPLSERSFSQEQAEEQFVELMWDKLSAGKGIELIARPGVAERALMILAMHEMNQENGISVIASDLICHYANVYLEYGQPIISNLVENGSAEQREITSGGRYVRIWDSTAGGALIGARGFKIQLEMTFRGLEEVAESQSGITRVGISSHASHEQTLEYIRTTGASLVVTDASRAKLAKAKALADVIKRDLGIEAYPRGLRS